MTRFFSFEQPYLPNRVVLIILIGGTINCMNGDLIKGKLQLLLWLIGIIPAILLLLFIIGELFHA